MRAFAVLLLLLGGLFAACQRTPTMVPTGRKHDYTDLAQRLATLDRPMPSVRAGDWLSENNEKDEPFEQYIASDPNRPTAQRNKIYLVAIGDFPPAQHAALARTAELLANFYAMPVRWLARIDPAKLPARARFGHSGPALRQLNTTYLLDHFLLERRPEDAVALLALTAYDLKAQDCDFVFGEASLSERVGVFSLARYGRADEPQALERTLKIALHETGHMFGLPHCVRARCGMNGSNSLAEADAQPLAFCASCERKVWWACRTDPRRRVPVLRDFAERHRLAEAAAHWRAAAEILQKP